MSSNRNNNVRGRVSSIRKSLAWQRVRMKIGIHLRESIFLMIVMLLVWLAAREYMVAAVPFLERSRSITLLPIAGPINSVNDIMRMLRTLRYTVSDGTSGKMIVDEMIFAPLAVIVTFGAGIFTIQLFFDLLSYSGQMRKIKRLFAPLDELASRAEEISKLELSEDKYHVKEIPT